MTEDGVLFEIRSSARTLYDKTDGPARAVLGKRNREGNEGERKYDQRDDCHDNPPGA